jgi:hypothetical protein
VRPIAEEKGHCRANKAWKKDTKKADALAEQVDALGKKLGPEYAALMDGLEDVDPESEGGKQIGLMFEPLDKLCAR